MFKLINSRSILVLILMLLSSCQKERPFDDPYQVPYSFGLHLSKNGVNLSDSVLSQSNLYYILNSQAIILDSTVYNVGYGVNIPDPAFIFGIQMGFISSRESKYFYIEFPDGDVDTLFVDFEELTNAEGRADPCYCMFPFRDMKYNGNEVTLDTSIASWGVFRYDKK